MVKNREINGTEEIGLVTPTPGGRNETVGVVYIYMRREPLQPVKVSGV